MASLFTSEVNITNTPLPIEGGNATDVKVDGSAHTQPVSGSVSVAGSVTVSNFPATQPVSGTVTVANPGLTDAQLRATPVPVSGTVTSAVVTSNTATITQVVSTGSNQTLLGANANRKKAIMFFGSGIWFVKFGTTASSSSFTYNITAGSTVLEIPLWVGQIDALCTTASKTVTITEMV